MGSWASQRILVQYIFGEEIDPKGFALPDRRVGIAMFFFPSLSLSP